MFQYQIELIIALMNPSNDVHHTGSNNNNSIKYYQINESRSA